LKIITTKNKHRIFAALLCLPLFPVAPVLPQDLFIDSDWQAREKSCKGYYSLTTDEKRKDPYMGAEWTLRDKHNNSTVIDFSETSWNPHLSSLDLYGCADIDNDGQFEAVVEYRSGGAHCCYTYFIYRKVETQLKLIGSIYLGNSSEPIFKDMDNDGIMEVLTLDDRLAYFDDLCFACSPFLPLIICYRNNSFTNCTARFPEMIEKEIQKTLNQRSSGFDLRGNALKYLALHIIFKKEADGWIGIRKYYPEASSWLKEHFEELKKKLDKEEFMKRNIKEGAMTKDKPKK